MALDSCGSLIELLGSVELLDTVLAELSRTEQLRATLSCRIMVTAHARLLNRATDDSVRQLTAPKAANDEKDLVQDLRRLHRRFMGDTAHAWTVRLHLEATLRLGWLRLRLGWAQLQPQSTLEEPLDKCMLWAGAPLVDEARSLGLLIDATLLGHCYVPKYARLTDYRGQMQQLLEQTLGTRLHAFNCLVYFKYV